MTPRHFFQSISALILLVSPAAALAQLTSVEEANIRKTYAKVSMATEVGVLVQGPAGVPSPTPAQIETALAQETVHFDIIRLSGGLTADVINTPLRDLVTFPSSTAIQIGLTNATSTDQSVEPPVVTRENLATAKWTKVGVDVNDLVSNMSLREFISRSTRGGMPRYAIADIRASLDGRSISYKALILFRSEQQFEILDFVAKNVDSFTNLTVYPHILLETYHRFKPFVQEWISSHQIQGCKQDVATECCDSKTLRCGVTPEDTASSLAALNPAVVKESMNVNSVVQSPVTNDWS